MADDNNTQEDGKHPPKQRKRRNQSSRTPAQNGEHVGQAQKYLDRKKFAADMFKKIDTPHNDPSVPLKSCLKKTADSGSQLSLATAACDSLESLHTNKGEHHFAKRGRGRGRVGHRGSNRSPDVKSGAPGFEDSTQRDTRSDDGNMRGGGRRHKKQRSQSARSRFPYDSGTEKRTFAEISKKVEGPQNDITKPLKSCLKTNTKKPPSKEEISRLPAEAQKKPHSQEKNRRRNHKDGKRKQGELSLDAAENSKLLKMSTTSSSSLVEAPGLDCEQNCQEDIPKTVVQQAAGGDAPIIQGFDGGVVESKAPQSLASSVVPSGTDNGWFGGYSGDSGNSQPVHATNEDYEITAKIEERSLELKSSDAPSITKSSSAGDVSATKGPFEFERGTEPKPCCGDPGDSKQQHSTQVYQAQPTFSSRDVGNQQQNPRAVVNNTSISKMHAAYGMQPQRSGYGKRHDKPKREPEKTQVVTIADCEGGDDHPRMVSTVPQANANSICQPTQCQKQEESPRIARQAHVDYESKKISAFGRSKSVPRTPFVPPKPICTCGYQHDFDAYLKQQTGSEQPATKNTVPWFIDSHCHLDFIYYTLEAEKDEKGNNYFLRTLKDFEKRWPKSFPSNFYGCIPNYIDPRHYTPSLKFEKYEPSLLRDQMTDEKVVACTIGCHPHLAKLYNSDVHQSIRNVARISTQSRNHLKAAASKLDNGVVTDYMKSKAMCQIHGPVWKFVAVGEIGLDFHKMHSDRKQQIDAFNQQLDIAVEYQMPVVIHCRSASGNEEAEDLCIKLMQKKLNRYWSVHRHCFKESVKVAQRWLDAFPNTVFGLTPLRLDEKSQAVLEALPLSNIVLETDAPYFSPASMRDHLPSNSNLPGAAFVVAEKLAEAKVIPVGEVLRTVRGNTIRMYDLFRFVAPEVAK